MTHPSARVSKLAEANMRGWLEREKLDQKIAEQPSHRKLGPYVAISRQCGTGAEQIAASLSEKLGWDLVGREIIEKIAKDFNVSTQLVEYVDEKHVAWLTEIFEAWIEGQSFCQEGYVKELGKLLMIAAQHGKCIMVGRGSQFILPRDYGLSVRLHAPFEYRVRKIMEAQPLPENKAKEFVTKTDEERARFLKTYFGDDGNDLKLYDLVIDTSRFTTESIVELLQTGIESVRLGTN